MSLVAEARALAYEVSDPAEDTRAFRNALGQYGTGVAVITAVHEGRPVAMTVNSFAAVSLDPPLVLWSLRNDSSRAPAFLAAHRFAVNVLAADQMEVARAVAVSGADGALAGVDWTEGVGGEALVDGAVARFECRVHDVLAGGDHQILVGRVDRCSVSEAEPLLFVQGGYATPEPLTQERADTGVQALPQGDADEPAPFAQLVTAASHRLSRSFDEVRARYGLGVASSRVLKRLGGGPLDVDALATTSYLGPRVVEDALSELLDNGLVARVGDRFHQTPAGHDLREQVAESARRFNDAALAGLPEADVAAAQRVLAALARDRDVPVSTTPHKETQR